MISIAVIGHGNVGTHLYHTFKVAKGIMAVHINSRALQDLPHVDIAILAVSDDVIAEVSSQIDTRLVVHTSGAAGITELKNSENKGVFYPLLTFTKNTPVNFSSTPICLEAEKESDLALLENLAKKISDHCYHINSEQRKSIHVSAVFVNNFVNHMYTIAYDICKEHGVPFEILLPIIEETTQKIKSLSPREAQTGPAKRNDVKTIKDPLALLSEQQQEIYTKLTQSIQAYGKKL